MGYFEQITIADFILLFIGAVLVWNCRHTLTTEISDLIRILRQRRRIN